MASVLMIVSCSLSHWDWLLLFFKVMSHVHLYGKFILLLYVTKKNGWEYVRT